MKTSRYAVIGWPVHHSVSPQMQQAAFDALDLPAHYERRAVAPEELAAAVEQLRNEGFAGWNVTVPHKQDIIPFLDEIDSGARRAGSVNTVLNRQGVLTGYSTDGYGLAAAVKESFGIDVTDRKFLFIGCGGAARAASIYFAAQGARELVLVNRTLARAEAVAGIAAAVAPDCQISCLRPDQSDRIARALRNCDAVIQSTSLGLRSDDPMPLDPELISARLAVMDMIYRQTPFLAAVAARGCRTADGRGMLLHQGARSFMLWTGQPAPVQAMREALERALAANSSQRGEGEG
jgi:shikimate dehydrogenase